MLLGQSVRGFICIFLRKRHQSGEWEVMRSLQGANQQDKFRFRDTPLREQVLLGAGAQAGLGGLTFPTPSSVHQ